MKRPDESGFIMALALVVLVIGSIVIVPGMSTASSLLKVNQISESNTDATYAAEAGLNYVMWKFNNGSPPTFPLTLPGNINGLTVTITEAIPAVQASAFSIKYTLKSAAMEATVTRGSVMAQVINNTGASPFHYGLVALNGDIIMSNSTQITSTPAGHGDVFANGNIYCHNSSIIRGSAGATGTIDSSHVTGSSSPNQLAKAFEDMDMSWYLNKANLGGSTGSVTIWAANNYNLGPKHITGDLNIGQSTVNLNGVVWVDGSVDINNFSRITGTSYIVANGSISVSNYSSFGGYPTLISNNGNITLSNNAAVGSLYAPKGTVYISNYATADGSIVAKSIQMANSASVNYPVNLATNPPPGFSGGGGSTVTSISY